MARELPVANLLATLLVRTLAFAGALAVTMALVATPAGAQTVYKWVDAEGKVHFGSQRPRETPAEVVELRVSPPPGADGAPAPAAAPPPDAPAQAGDASPVSEQEAAERQLNAINCRIARRNLETLQSLPDEVAERDREGGVTRLSPEEIADRLDRALADVDKYCP